MAQEQSPAPQGNRCEAAAHTATSRATQAPLDVEALLRKTVAKIEDQASAEAERLREAGVPTVCRRYDGMFHGFFSMGELIDTGKRALEDAASALREALER